MQAMMREIILIVAMVGIGLLILAKGDKQIVHILEGKLFHRDMDMEQAAVVYRKHKRFLSIILVTLGFAAIGLSIILLTNGSRMFPISAIISLVLVGLGAWDRLRSFRAADRELS
ncbi:hypothetical protein ACFSUK_07275 [Sphingobium scionense]|uniref:DUF3784 domain-containing protein n=1 Tax=Sphingobium scionense TaxID=1404341 RepID=A0A7W6LVS0_9SPHN|nr:hypothetical protein [Sphingobium scionense]MBB4150638.1 hypothetical protein [Sphingobium scionense]